MGLKALIRKYKEKKQFDRFVLDNTWEGLIPGDVMEYKERKYLYQGINRNGGPGMPGFPEPVFGPINPLGSNQVWYLRHESTYPFGNIPEVMSESTPSAKDISGTLISFLNATRNDLKKVDHITQEQWNEMLEGAST